MLFNLVIGTVQLFHLLDSSHIPEKLLDFFQMIFVRKIVELPSKFTQKWNMKAITGKVLSDKDFAITLQKNPHKLSSRIWELPHANSRSPTTLLSCLKTSCSNLVQGKDQRWASQLHLGAYQALYKHQRWLVLLPTLQGALPILCPATWQSCWMCNQQVHEVGYHRVRSGAQGKKRPRWRTQIKTASHPSSPKPLLSRLKAAVLQWGEPFGGKCRMTAGERLFSPLGTTPYNSTNSSVSTLYV